MAAMARRTATTSTARDPFSAPHFDVPGYFIGVARCHLRNSSGHRDADPGIFSSCETWHLQDFVGSVPRARCNLQWHFWCSTLYRNVVWVWS
jgi:hypothetical protein